MRTRSAQPTWFLWLVLVLLLAAAVFLRPHDRPVQTGPGEYFFCFWNVENLFDDQRDDWKNAPDRDFDAWFADSPAVLQQKLARLSEALVALNGGKGPDILALAEIESQRAVELLRETLNQRLADESQHYGTILYKDPHGGRHIATAILSRVPAVANRTQLLGKRQRILEGHLQVNGHDLVVVASHWTSRVTDTDGRGRADYADKIYGAFRAMYTRNPDVDFLVCGDFNDTPDDPSVAKHLHALDDVNDVRQAQKPLFLNLLGGKDPQKYGTHYHHKWFLFDQVAVSPGLLDDKGWSCDPASVHVVRSLFRPGDKLKRPWSFGPESARGQRGYSDHFPVTVKLKVGE